MNSASNGAPWHRGLGTAALLAGLQAFAACAAQGADPPAAASLRGGESATLALTPAAAAPPRVLTVPVTAFTPSAAGSSEVVVRAAPGGAEIGRFGIFPNDAFRAASPRQEMRFDLPLAGRLPRPGADAAVQVEFVAPPDARIVFGAPRVR